MAMFIPLAVAIGTSAGAFAIAGAALGAIGALTGNKGLSMVGGLIGLAGGAFSAFGGAESLAGDAVSTAGMAADVVDDFAGAAAGADSVANVAGIASNVPTGAETILSGADAAGNLVSAPGSEAVNTQLAGGNTAVLDGVNPGGLDGPLGDSMSPTNLLDGDPASKGAAGSPFEKASLGETAGSAGQGGILDRFQEWFKTNPGLAKTAGDFVKGGFDGALKSKSNKELMEIYRQRNATDIDRQALQRELAARGIKNASYVPGSTGMGLNQNASLYPAGAGPSAYRFGGLLNGSIGK